MWLAKSVFIVFLLFVNYGMTTESCDRDMCDKDASDEKHSDCGCSINREQTSDYKPDAKADDVGKYSTHFNIESPYPRTNEMVLIPAGSFIMGTNKPYFVADGEGPERKVTLSQFYLDKHEVSNAEFELFVNATGYITEVYFCG